VGERQWTPIEVAKSGFATCASSNVKAALLKLFFGRSKKSWLSENVMQLESVRREIERMRIQVHHQRREIRQLQQGGIPIASAEALLDRMLNKIDELCAGRTG
jgi:hypothetical protein